MFAPLILLAAVTAQQEPPIVVEGEKSVVDKPVCRTERSTGSRVVKQVCKTAEQLQKDDEAARNKLRMGNQSTRPTEAFKAPTGQ
jgi:hypothetical protein